MRNILFICLIFPLFALSQTQKVTIKLNEKCKLELERSIFDKTKHKFEYVDNKIVIAVDGIPLFGSDGEMPKYMLTKATLKIANKTYNLQVDNMYNPWFGDGPNEKMFKIQNNGAQSVLQGVFSDGAGTYGAEWLIWGDSSIRTILTQDENILFEYFDDK